MQQKNRKKLLIALFIVHSFATFGQTDNRFYKTMEDLLNDKPIAGYEIVSNSLTYFEIFGNSKESFIVIVNGQSEKLELSRLPSELYKYEGNLYRTFDKSCYLILEVGHYCYYVLQHENNVRKYSESITGDMNKFKEKWFEAELKKYELLEEYKNEKPRKEKNETGDAWLTKIVSREIKYFKLLNEKLKR